MILIDSCMFIPLLRQGIDPAQDMITGHTILEAEIVEQPLAS